MQTESTLVRDAVAYSLEMARDITVDHAGNVGWGYAELFKDVDPERPRHLWKPDVVVPFANLITDIGDNYAALAVIRSIGPSGPATQPTVFPNGMKLGTGSTAVAKNSTGAALVTYLSGSNAAFDSGYATSSNLGAGLGVNAVMKTTWAAGTATNSAIAEAAIVADSGTNATSSVANTLARTVFGSTINKGASDTLSVTWNWKYLGA